MASAAYQALKRLLVNGPLTGFPTRRADAELLLELAAARFEADRDYSEAEVNDVLRDWLASFCEPYGIDHVSMRRQLVDARYLARERSGAKYRLLRNAEHARVDPVQVLGDIREERAARKKDHVGQRAGEVR